LDAKDGNGWTPLHGAAYKGHDSIVALLIAGGADLNAKDADGDTPWDWAKNKPETADLLRKHGGKAGSALK
jgi:ankyrin repeat protein